MLRTLLVTSISILLLTSASGAEETRLLRNPSVSDQHVAFVYANDIWIVGRDGGEARRLTTFDGAETEPHFSPDGSLVAFSGQYDGNTDVYVVSTAGGEPRRLTWHPGPDNARGWTPDGSAVVFSSGRINVPLPNPRLWSIALDASMPEALPIPRVTDGKFSPDGKRIAYRMVEPYETEFRYYRGGQVQPIRIIDVATHETQELPWDGSHDIAPVWLDDTIFFLSDRDWTMNVWSYNTRTRQLQQRTHFEELDCKRLEGGAGTLVFENGGVLYTMAAAGGEPRRLQITAKGDFPWARPHWEDVSKQIRSAALSPSGKRAVFEARGEIFTVPAKHGDVRNLSRSSGAADRSPVWSPDGRSIAWFSDESGEYQLVVSDQFGQDKKSITLEEATFFYTPRWSPDSKHVAFGDTDRALWIVTLEPGKVTRIDDEGFSTPDRLIYPEWSPDSKWVVYSRRLPNQFNGVFVYSVEQGKSFPITDGMSDAFAPAWDRSGKYIYFLASTDYALNVAWLDMSSYNRPANYAIYLAVLSRDEPSPLAPRSDDEEIADDEGDEGKSGAADDQAQEGKGSDVDAAPTVRIDFEGLDQRILALDVPAGSYRTLRAGKEGTLFYGQTTQPWTAPQAVYTVHQYALEDRKSTQVVAGALDFALSADGEKLLYHSGEGWFLTSAAGEAKPGDGQLNLTDVRMHVDPTDEWKQIFTEAWRYQRDYFYVDNVHGLDMDWAHKTYGQLVEHVRHRADLTYILDMLGGETSVGHSFTMGGDEPDVDVVPVGMLGADLSVSDERYRIDRIYTGENWNPDLRAPLSGPGIDIAEGDYLLAVNGVALDASMNLFSVFDRTADKRVVLTVNDRPSLENARQVTVVPVDSEQDLRTRAWVEDNRRKVDELSNGQLAYVWVPDTGLGGYTSFSRYYFAQQDKKGVVIDERFNQGGSIADYMVDIMSRELHGFFNNPVGDRQPFTAPNAAIWGPKVMIVNEMAGSGGDMLPYLFRKMEIGPLVGTRTWGGLVGIWDVPPLVDGGMITAPRGGFYNLDGEWDVENQGIAPDYEVEQLPHLVNAGQDPQLEEAVRIALERMAAEGVAILPQPEDPVRMKGHQVERATRE